MNRQKRAPQVLTASGENHLSLHWRHVQAQPRNLTDPLEGVFYCAEPISRAGSAATGSRAFPIGGAVGNGLDRQKSASNVELRPGAPFTKPPSNNPGDYWTKRYLSQELHRVAFSTDEENNCHNGGMWRT